MKSCSFTLKKKDIQKIKNDLMAKGFIFKDLPYGYFSAQNKFARVNVNVYNSLKCLVQGKGTEDFVRFYLEPEILKNFQLDYGHLDYEEKIGMDESGKGDYFGPLTVASVYVNQESYSILKTEGVMDSKKIKDNRIFPLEKLIKKHCKFNTLIINPEKYNLLYKNFQNLNALLAWSHVACLKTLLKNVSAKKILLDKFGPSWRLNLYLKKAEIDVPVDQMVRAESDIAVAAASILARALFLQKLKFISDHCSIEIPKGSGEKADKVAKEFVDKYGRDKLSEVAKLHFKNTEKLIL